jgi:hypothetical protein
MRENTLSSLFTYRSGKIRAQMVRKKFNRNSVCPYTRNQNKRSHTDTVPYFCPPTQPPPNSSPGEQQQQQRVYKKVNKRVNKKVKRES